MFNPSDPFDAEHIKSEDRGRTINDERVQRLFVNTVYENEFNCIKSRRDIYNPMKIRRDNAIISWCRKYGSDEIITPVTFSMLIQKGLKHFKSNNIKVTKNDLLIGLGRHGDKTMHDTCIITYQMGFLADMNDSGEYEYDDLYS